MTGRSPAQPGAVRLAAAWVGWYTRALAEPLRSERRDEVVGDAWDQLADQGSGPATTRAVVRRVLLGVPADLSWRHHQLRRQRRTVQEGASPMNSSPRNTAWHRRGWLDLARWLATVEVVAMAVMAVGSLADGDPLDAFLAAGLAGIALGAVGCVLMWRSRRAGAGLLVLATLLFLVPWHWSWLAAVTLLLVGSVCLAAWWTGRGPALAGRLADGGSH